MAHRPGIFTSIRYPVDGGVSPNRYVAELSVEVRAHWPPLTPLQKVLDALTDAHRQAISDVYRVHGENA